jgi:hypothetical protein
VFPVSQTEALGEEGDLSLGHKHDPGETELFEAP